MKPWPSRRWTWLAWGGAALFAAATIPVKLFQFASLNIQLYDFGEDVNVMWNTLHGRPFWSSVMEWNYLSQHFAPLQALFAPLPVLTGTAASVLVAQSLILGAGIPAVYLIARRLTDHTPSSLALAALFGLSPFLHEVHRVDFHEVSVGITLVLWTLYAWEYRRVRLFCILAAALLLLREDYGLYLAGFGAAVWWSEKKDGPSPVRPWKLVGAGLLWTGAVVLLVMPAFGAGQWHPAQSSYGTVGGGGLLAAFLKPSTWLALASPERLLAPLRLLCFTGGLALFSPRRSVAWLLPLTINLLAQKFWQYRLELHYSATVLPFLFWASAHGLAQVRLFLGRRWGVRALRGAAVGLGGIVVLNAAGIPRYFYMASPERRRAARELAAMVPAGESVAAQTNLLPLMALRADVALAPPRRPARWVFLDMLLARQAGLGPVQYAYLERFRHAVVAERGDLFLLHFPEAAAP